MAASLLVLPGDRASGARGEAISPRQTPEQTYRLVDTWANVPWRLVAGRYGRVGDIASAPDGTTYVLDVPHGAIHVLSANGSPLRVWKLPQLPGDVDARLGWSAQRLDVASDGTLLVLSQIAQDAGDATVTWSWIDALTPLGDRRHGFLVRRPYTDLAASPDGTVVLSRNRPIVQPTAVPGEEARRLPGGVDVFDRAGGERERIERPEIFYALGVDVDADGTIYVVNRAPSPWDYDRPGPHPTPPPALAAPAQDAPGVVEGIVILDPAHAVREVVPFVTPEDVAVGPIGAFVSRNVEIFALRETAPLYSGPPGGLAVGFVDGIVLHLDVTAQGRLLGGMAHCYFQGVLRFDRPWQRPGEAVLVGGLDRPDLAGPVHPWRLSADESIAVAQSRFTVTRSSGEVTYHSVPYATEPQSIQRWSAEGRLIDQMGVCSGSTSGWLPDPSDALWTRDVAVDGTDVYTIDPNLLHLRPDDRFPAWAFWPGAHYAPDTVSHLIAVAADDGHAAVLDAGARRVIVLDRAGDVVANWAWSGDADAAYATDLAMRDGRIYLADSGANRVLVRDVAGAEIAAWPTHDAPWRISATADGGVLALGRRGWAMRYDVTGALAAAWPMPDRRAQAVDIAAGRDGRVYVAWVDREAEPAAEGFSAYRIRGAGIWVFEPAATEPAGRPAIGACLAHVDKMAAPNIVQLGEATQVTLTVDGSCPGRSDPAQIVLLLDTSRSMNWHDALERASNAALTLLARLDARSTEVGLVTFDDAGALVEPLTRDLARVAMRVSALEAWGDTRLAAGIGVAAGAFTAAEGDGTRRLIVVITDGEFTDAAQEAANAARAAGIEIHAIALPHGGLGGYLASLRMITGQEVLVDPDAALIERMVDRIVRYRPADVLFDRVVVEDRLPANMVLVPGSTAPPAAETDSTLTWTAGALLAGRTLSLTYRVRPVETGTWPTNVRAEAIFRDSLGNEGSRVFPVPEVRVWDRSSLGVHLYLPVTTANACFRSRGVVDVLLAIDASESMAEPAVTGGTKLGAARAAATHFLDLLRLPSDRAAVVSFNERATVRSDLTGDRAAIAAALAAIEHAPGTRIDLGLAAATQVLRAARPEAQAVVVLLTDGIQTGEVAPVRAASLELRGRGVWVFAIGLGASTDAALLSEIASTPGDHLESPDERDLENAYRRVLGRLVCRLEGR